MDTSAGEFLSELFTYDKHLPLEAIESEIVTEPDQTHHHHVVFGSVHDQRVPALLTLPVSVAPPFPVILLLHGVLGHKDSFNQKKRSAYLNAAGYATMRIDGQYRGEREVALGVGAGLRTEYHYRNRDAMLQTTIDLMRALDYLASRDDIDMRRIGFAGFSMGGSIGALFCAHEPRVKAAVLAITGGDFRTFRRSARAGSSDERMMKAYRIVDPVLYVSGIAPRPLLMVNAAHDEIVPRMATDALFEAAREPKRIIWYECGHAELPDSYLGEMKAFFDAELR